MLVELPFLVLIKSFSIVLLIFLLPGGAFLAWCPSRDRDALTWLAEAVGLSVSLTALAALFFLVIDRSVSPAVLIGSYTSLALLGLAGRLVHHPTTRPGKIPWLTLLVFLILIAWRFYQVRGLSFPPWVDAPHHVLITLKVLEVGGLPADLGPALPVPFYYHFGFHVMSALFTGLSGLPPEKAVLWLGQLFNALVSLSVYFLGRKIWAEPGRAGLAALLTGIVSQMPAYYATWGRYSLLCGLTLLPLAMGLTVEIDRSGRQASSVMKQAILVAGTGLSHYLTAGLLGLFGLILLGERIWNSLRTGRTWKESVWGPTVGLAAGAVLILPWIIWLGRSARRWVGMSYTAWSQSLDQAYFSGYGGYLVYLLGPQRNYLLILLALLGLPAALGDLRSRTLALWGLVMGAGVIPWGFHISPFRPDHLAIVLFLPVCLLVSQGAGEFLDWFKRRNPATMAGKVALCLFLALVIWGIRETRWIIKPETVLADVDDRRAIHWIQDHTPETARFLINGTPWEWGIYRGVDGGWWITPLTGRWSSLPPIYYGFGGREMVDRIKARAERTSRLEGCGVEFWDLVRELGITHVYTRSGQGHLSPDWLKGCRGVELEYQQGPVQVFKII